VTEIHLYSVKVVVALSIESVTCSEMRALELNAEYLGISPLQLMENAGSAVSSEIASRFKPANVIVVYAGVGRNGGDGLVAARHLASKGFKVTVNLVGKSEAINSESAKKNLDAILNMSTSVDLVFTYDSSLIKETDADVVVDALLGTGITGPLRPPVLQAVKAVNDSRGFKVAIDVPTGVDPDTGAVLDRAVLSDLTVTFHKPKAGLLKAKEYTGELVVADIGIPNEARLYAGPGDVYLTRKKRPPESHKGDFGRLLVIGGSETFSGAPTLTALAAMRTGVDLTYVATPTKTAYAISAMASDLITIKLEGEHFKNENIDVIKRWLKRSDGVVIGPGLGLNEETTSAVEETFKIIEESKKPLLLDADGLKAFADFKHQVEFPLVLTPHAGEFEILTGKKTETQLEKKVDQVKKAAASLNATIILKGNVDVVSDGENVKMNFTGNPGMTVGGTGDVLSGIVAAFLVHGYTPFRSATAGVFINGVAGDLALREKGFHLVPSDLIDWIPDVIDDPMCILKMKQQT